VCVYIKLKQSLYRPRGFQEVEAPRFGDSWYIKVERLPGLLNGRLYPPPQKYSYIPGTHFCKRLSRHQGHSAAEWIMSMKNSNDTIGNRTRVLPYMYICMYVRIYVCIYICIMYLRTYLCMYISMCACYTVVLMLGDPLHSYLET